jgi:hypothetical protein
MSHPAWWGALGGGGDGGAADGSAAGGGDTGDGAVDVGVAGISGDIQEERWLNGSATDCKSVVLGSNPAPPQHTANSASPEVGSHLG